MAGSSRPRVDFSSFCSTWGRGREDNTHAVILEKEPVSAWTWGYAERQDRDPIQGLTDLQKRGGNDGSGRWRFIDGLGVGEGERREGERARGREADEGLARRS